MMDMDIMDYMYSEGSDLPHSMADLFAVLADGGRSNNLSLPDGVSGTLLTGIDYDYYTSLYYDESMAELMHNVTGILESRIKIMETQKHADVYVEPHILVKVFLGSILALSVVVCGLADSVMCWVVLRYRRMRTVVNILLANVALSDLLVALFSAPLFLHSYCQSSWAFGQTLCIMAGYIKNMSLYVSTNTLLAIAINRYIVVTHPLRKRLTARQAGLVALFVWPVSLLVALPTLLYSTVVIGVDLQTRRPVPLCIEHWPRNPAGALKAYSLFLLVAEFLLPMTLMTYCYAVIACRVWKRFRPVSSATSSTASASLSCTSSATRRYADCARAKRRTYAKLIIVLGLFLLCWTPYYGYAVWQVFFPRHWKQSAQRVNVFYLVEGVAMSNAMVNAVISVGINDNLALVISSIKVTLAHLKQRNRRATCTSFLDILDFHHPSNNNSSSSSRPHLLPYCPRSRTPTPHNTCFISSPCRPNSLPLAPYTDPLLPCGGGSSGGGGGGGSGGYFYCGCLDVGGSCGGKCGIIGYSGSRKSGGVSLETPDRIRKSRSESDRSVFGPI